MTTLRAAGQFNNANAVCFEADLFFAFNFAFGQQYYYNLILSHAA